MSNVEDILAYAWGKDSENLKSAVDSALTSKVSDIVANMAADVSASMFGNSAGEDNTQEEIPQPEQELPNNEEPDLEGSDNAE